MFVLIAGGGRTASTLAGHLLSQRHEVRLVEHRADVLRQLHRELPTEVIYVGVPTQPGALEDAGIRRADVLVACMAGDEDNLSVCFIGRAIFNVARTIGVIDNPRASWLFDDKFHVDVAVNQADILAHLIEEEMSMGDMMTLLKLRRGRYSLVAEKIPPGAPAVGIAIKDLPLPQHSVIAAVIRGGQIVVPNGDVRFEAGDEVLAVVDPPAAATLADLFGDRRERVRNGAEDRTGGCPELARRHHAEENDGQRE